MLELIKELREKTGAGMLDCQKALRESGNDPEKAVEYLRKQGIAKAAKRCERTAAEGIILTAAAADGRSARMIEVRSETDFVARNDRFKAFAASALEALAQRRDSDLAAFLGETLGSATVGETLANLSGTIGEKLEISRIAVLETAGTAAAYSHAGGKIGVILSLDQPGQAELARDIAMQIAAANPKYLSRGQVPPAEIEKENEIYREQLQKEGKPEAMIEKILPGKLNKYFEDVCLLDQEYIKDDKRRIKDVLGDAEVEAFARFSLN